jgi:putative Mn2+ efflux pump MntP
MTFIELLMLAIGLSMDAFAVSITIGLTLGKATIRKSLIVGLYFGFFQAAMPLIGFFAATRFADMIVAYDHWIAFVLLSIIGGKMIKESLAKDDSPENETKASLKPSFMLPLAIATSIDALIVGVSLALLRVNIIPTVSFIGMTTLVLSMIGVKIGQLSGSQFKSKAELAGGIILILIGAKVLVEHLALF